MKITGFHGLIYSEHTDTYILQNCDVVIDGQNYFFELYMKSGLPYQTGCDCDRYAQFLRRYLDIFKKANVTCYVLFMGGHKNRESLVRPPHQSEVVIPILCKSVQREVFQEMGFRYVTCELDPKSDSIALAHKLKCPIISCNTEFCFADVPYIPNPTYDCKAIQFDDSVNGIRCRKFELKQFIQKLGLSKELLAVFIAIMDQTIFAPKTFEFAIQKIISPFMRNQRYTDKNKCRALLNWLSRMKNANTAITAILKYKVLCKPVELRKKINDLISSLEKPKDGGLPMQGLLDYYSLMSSENSLDQWFERGIVIEHIGKCYINLINHGIVKVYWSTDYTSEHPIKLSLDIIKYGFNLLTNFKRNDFILYNKADGKHETINCSEGIPNPETVGIIWRDEYKRGASSSTLKHLKLFEHFFNYMFTDFDFIYLDQFQEDTRLFIITLKYFNMKRGNEKSDAVTCGIMLCNVMMSVEMDNDFKEAEKELKDYFTVERDVIDVKEIIKTHQEILHSVLQFQECLQQMNYLNKMCGSPLEPTVYSKTFSGSFVYSVAVDIGTHYNGDGVMFLEDKLRSAPSILNKIKPYM